jgi:septum formation protein
MELVLASSSPRRQELLRAARIPFSVRPSHVPEKIEAGESAREYCERLAFDKANAVWNPMKAEGVLVLGADTTVVAEGRVLEKPRDAADAKRMIGALSGRAHTVITGVCLLGGGVHDVRSATTTVHVDRMSEEEIAEYVASGEPMDKAGGYGIQGMFSRWITRVEGDYPNVVGLPVAMVCRMLKAARFL